MAEENQTFNLVGERIKERTENRLQIVEERRAKRQDNISQFESIDFFYKEFTQMKDLLQEKVESVSTGTDPDFKNALDSLNSEIQLLQEFLNTSSMFLPSFQIKKSQQYIDSLQENLKRVTDILQPKKKFGFRNKKKEKPIKTSSPETLDTSQCEKNLDTIRNQIVRSTFYGFKDMSDQNLTMTAEELKNRQLSLHNLVNCKVTALGNAGSLQIANLRNCVVVLGPTTRSAFIKECSECTFVIACQQVRIHNTTDTNFYLHVTGAAIIEDCEDVHFAPYNLEYEQLSKHYEESGLSLKVNNWEKVDDFSWLNENEKSPNYSIIIEDLRTSSWLH